MHNQSLFTSDTIYQNRAVKKKGANAKKNKKTCVPAHYQSPQEDDKLSKNACDKSCWGVRVQKKRGAV